MIGNARPAGFRVGMPTVGYSPDRSLCFPTQRKVATLLHEIPISNISRGECSSPTMERPVGLCVPSGSPDIEVPPVSGDGEDIYSGDYSTPAEKTVVPASQLAGG